MQELFLKKLHQQAGARFGEFAGTNMPIMYEAGVLQEHLYTRASAGLFDISHMRLIIVEGEGAEALLQLCLPLNLAQLAPQKSQYSFFLNENAGIIDDLIITKLAQDRYYIVVNAANAAKDLAHLKNHNMAKAKISTPECVLLALQGPNSAEIMKRIGLAEALELNFMQGMIWQDFFITRSGYTGEDGFEIAMPAQKAEALVEAILATSQAKWVGLAARDSLRLEAGLCLHGNDIDETINPAEAGLLWAIPKLLRSQDAAYLGAASLARIIEEKPKKLRCGFLPKTKQPVRKGATIHLADGTEIGYITSGTYSPSLDKPIAMGYIPRIYKNEAPVLFAKQRGKSIELELTPLPFVAHNYYNKAKNKDIRI